MAVKGTVKTRTRKKKGRGSWEVQEETEEEVPVPKDKLKALIAAAKANRPMAKAVWGFRQSVALGRLDPGHQYEIMEFYCEVHMPCEADWEALDETIDECIEYAEARIGAKVEELEEALEAGDD